ncbi:hypothetical protein M9H77_18142 [Catharanthus roseus]|uniref:Uncharacterized protein n=1 Tax=Catharanthus roseus TaxID=4058 RepID=A0ACC0B6N7_CATRO|nr:hypothetical protein M9H77_18142 [Catharanthus roseus]
MQQMSESTRELLELSTATIFPVATPYRPSWFLPSLSTTHLQRHHCSSISSSLFFTPHFSAFSVTTSGNSIANLFHCSQSYSQARHSIFRATAIVNYEKPPPSRTRWRPTIQRGGNEKAQAVEDQAVEASENGGENNFQTILESCVWSLHFWIVALICLALGQAALKCGRM